MIAVEHLEIFSFSQLMRLLSRLLIYLW